MIYYKTSDEVALIKKSSLLVCDTIAEVTKHVKPGITTLQLDKIAEQYIRDNHGEPAFKGYKGSYPFTLCTSVNEHVVHGFPNNRELKETDVVSIDTGVKLNGYYGDSAYTVAMNGISDADEQLLIATKTSLFLGIDKARNGGRVGDISFAIQEYIERKKKYHIVRELVGHGVGKYLHEDPEVPNYGKRGNGAKLQPGMVIAIEPMVNKGTRHVVQLSDGWTISTRDRSTSAHYELMVHIGTLQTDVLNNFDSIEDAVSKNNNLKMISSEVLNLA
jgi:methionyl aminopeptidase